MNLFDYAPPKPAEPFAIQRGIPIPTSREHRVKSTWERPEFKFSDMEIGDSFEAWPHECGGAPLIVVQNMVSGAAATFCKTYAHGRKFTTRQLRGQFVRCWRVE